MFFRPEELTLPNFELLYIVVIRVERYGAQS
jgi:hypothetical protein